VKLRFSQCFDSLTQPVTPLASNVEVRKPCVTLQAKVGFSYLGLFVSVEAINCSSAPEIKAVSADKSEDSFIRIGFYAVLIPFGSVSQPLQGLREIREKGSKRRASLLFKTQRLTHG
jgi:hypothetical protein